MKKRDKIMKTKPVGLAKSVKKAIALTGSYHLQDICATLEEMETETGSKLSSVATVSQVEEEILKFKTRKLKNSRARLSMQVRQAVEMVDSCCTQVVCAALEEIWQETGDELADIVTFEQIDAELLKY